MRSQKRGAEPGVLAKDKKRWTAAWVKRRKKNQAADFIWPTSGGKKLNHLLRPHLATLTQEHCSFCDSFPIEPPGKETIEHFRPKSGYEKHAYQWDNLFLACSCCQSAKGEKFKAALLKPDSGGYRFDDWFLADLTDGRLVPHPTLRGRALLRAKTTIELYGLDSAGQRVARKLWIHEYGPGHKDSVLDRLPFREWMKHLV